MSTPETLRLLSFGLLSISWCQLVLPGAWKRRLKSWVFSWAVSVLGTNPWKLVVPGFTVCFVLSEIDKVPNKMSQGASATKQCSIKNADTRLRQSNLGSIGFLSPNFCVEVKKLRRWRDGLYFFDLIHSDDVTKLAELCSRFRWKTLLVLIQDINGTLSICSQPLPSLWDTWFCPLNYQAVPDWRKIGALDGEDTWCPFSFQGPE